MQTRAAYLACIDAVTPSLDPSVLAPVTEPFSHDGGLKLLDGNPGRAIINVSAVKLEHRVAEAPAILSIPETLRCGGRTKRWRDYHCLDVTSGNKVL